MRLLIQHKSHYRYPEPAHLGPHMLRLRPADHTSAKIETYSIEVPQAKWTNWLRDPYGNHVLRATFDPDQGVEALDVLVEMTVDLRPVNPFDFFIDDRAERFPFDYGAELRRELAPHFDVEGEALATDELFEALLEELPAEGKTIDVVVDINRRIHAAVNYIIREEPGVFTPEQTLARGEGSCRDSAMLLVAALRHRGLAARFVSGYAVQVTDEGMLPDLPKGLDHDAVDLHAWAEVYLPGAGWIGLDATSGLLCGEGHIPLATAATPVLAAPIDGTTTVGADHVEFEMNVARLGHEPTPTTPYEEPVWAQLLEASREADRKLADAGVVLTMGGEPTFNSRLHPDDPEWEGEALGPTKWTQGIALARELRRRLLPGGCILHRMGKHYPGESLPRWALDVYGRRDGTPLWTAGRESSRVPTVEDARRMIEAIRDRLGVRQGVYPAYEDPWHFIHQEAQMPMDADPMSADLGDPEERQRLARVLNHGLGRPVGFAMPLVRQGPTWFGDEWSFRRGHLFLLPGDSPMGLRLPLDSIAGLPYPVTVWEEPYEPRDPRLGEEDEVEAPFQQARMLVASAGGATQYGVRTALCCEVRESHGQTRVFVFLPPLRRVEEFVDLVETIDAVRLELDLPVVLEGYPPPKGPALESLSVTPDPGVLEVNLPVTSSTDEYAQLLETVYEAGLHAGLHSEKYLLDGRQAGSGGGHHLTLGGKSPLESPFLRRPELLGSLITFLQHHPSMSYMFTGLFVGPTSQAPRVDEARHESLYELELALQRVFDGPGDPPPPWYVDMLFRHLLIDMSGNTHRAELSIDKLFDYQTPHGRQGIVEMRAFEMPPHPRMAIAQMLLMRGLVAAFTEAPYLDRLVRWGTTLHDKFLLPYWMWQDFEDVLAFLNDRGVEFRAEHFRPFLDLRCPVVGRADFGGVSLEVRNAIEPWNVLGEEVGGAGTSRYVDSSMERIQLRVEGLVPERHAVLVNGLSVPLRPTGKAQEFVAGVRFRAWAPPHSLHPHIGIHHPIRIDVLDRWGQRSMGACTYHVWHPEGRAFEAAPLTRFEAAARRERRFTLGGHATYPVGGVETSSHGDVPYTMDLRRFPIDRPEPKAEAPAEGAEADSSAAAE